MGEKTDKRNFLTEMTALIKTFPMEELDKFDLSLLYAITGALNIHTKIVSTLYLSMGDKDERL